MIDFDELFSEYPVRFDYRQKKAFLSYLECAARSSGYGTQRQQGGKAVNLICGDLSAPVIFTAHYDTARRLRRGITSVPGENPVKSYFRNTFFNRSYGPNQVNNNDNDSGIYTLLLMMERLKGKGTFVFFDREEDGLKGSRLFNKKYKKTLNDRIIVNLDCVGRGDRFGVIYYRSHICGYAKELAGRLDGFYRMAGYSFSTDAQVFLNAVSVSVFKGPAGSEYFDSIHCGEDNVCSLGKLVDLSAKLSSYIVNDDSIMTKK